MKNYLEEPYHVVEDNHGGKAKVYFSNEGKHKIVFSDNKNHEFFTEEYVECPIEIVEQAANDWAIGKRQIVGGI